MKITTKGQVTIPQELREQYGFLAHTEVEFKPGRGGLRLVKTTRAGRRGQRLIRRMAGRGDGTLTTDQIMQLTRGES
ncbi:MAG: hypothetical protein A3K19_22810 [Lentisphaerae bacterium RIFOXYB12_FULL_65_16]|nr:MAG: hypothetical protein A3K18_16945 [Lentisphaerae bacterium RIFOXYA12_64_32]OGV90042.1 MAG: hypothetical protein A3K19_22810 [Lentisphaerae bacterium RIFOXYB12_FULL_65_16]